MTGIGIADEPEQHALHAQSPCAECVTGECREWHIVPKEKAPANAGAPDQPIRPNTSAATNAKAAVSNAALMPSCSLPRMESGFFAGTEP
ncbi:conserved hypothetical protein [Ricinus communis]|uniref:Uncharacterized protein n=1 Tax=Ricinus communis TaxID=3988 RepID=B9TN47_RICCO|nr:conserved hypothetical protein [Ricinus communis]